MKVNKNDYIQLHNKISDIVIELFNVQQMIEKICDAENLDIQPSKSNTKKEKRRGKPDLDSVVDEFSIAMVNDGIDSDTILKLENILRKKKDEFDR